ncbi:MmpS family transport accessory protein [Pseudonocardia sp. KRD291]|uniref:MmpS family transport accessory protein n=1 Tax=Pseudonocardia sp. KRD291 TaxID=2792007 RepID=UPI001C4A74A1|nr:MmpS family transport accessory protein [Pseudonocardia sp. KRD291]MBW0102723.1 hypothetical protein [Pseudonocardia sp. KRD291]
MPGLDDHAPARHDDTGGYEPARYAHVRPGYAYDEFGPDDHDLDDREPDGYAPYENASDGYDSEYDSEYDSDDDRTTWFPAGDVEAIGGPASDDGDPDGGPDHHPDDGPDDGGPDAPAAEGPGPESPHRRARAGRSDERPTRRRRWPWVVGGVAAAAVVVPLGLTILGSTEQPRESSQTSSIVGLGTSGSGATGTGASGTGPSGSGPSAVAPPAGGAAPQPAAAQVTYEVTGSGSAGTITFGRGTSVAQASDAELPWTRSTPAAAEPAEYTLTAAGGSGTVSCKIRLGDVVLAEETAEGDFAAVSCSGRR